MEWIYCLNRAMNYIEEHLQDEIKYEEIAKLACCSTYHFQRMFAYMANMPLSEYIRRRRMTMAAVQLQSTDIKIVDLALSYGYESPTAFNRAFQSIHGVTPSKARQEGISLKAYPPISFNLSIKGDVEMNYRIETKEAFRIVGISAPLHQELEKNFEVVPMMWQKAAMTGIIPKLGQMMNGELNGILGVSACNEREQWKYFIAATSNEPLDESLEEYIVPAATWAIFYGEGTMPDSIQDLEKRIVTEWLPSSGYEYGNAPDIEVYLSPDPQNAKFEVWIPVIKKEGH